MKIRILIIISFILVGLLNAIVSGVLHYASAIQFGINEASQKMLAIAEARADYAGAYMDSLMNRMVDFSSDGKIKDCLSDISDKNINGCSEQELTNHLINNKLPAIKELDKVYLLDVIGKVVASSDENLIGEDKSADTNYLDALSAPVVHFKGFGENLRIIVSAPVQKITGDMNLIGVIVGEMKPEKLMSIVANRNGLGKTGEVLIATNDSGRIRSLFKGAFEFEEEESKSGFEPVEMDPAEHVETFSDIFDYRQERVIAVTKYVEAGKIVLVVKIDRQEIYNNQTISVLFGSIGIGFIIVVVALLAGLAFSIIILKPISQLKEAANDITSGKKGEMKDILRKDELGDLARAFSEMNQKIQIAKASVEKEVVDRTQELQEKNKNLEDTKVAMMSLMEDLNEEKEKYSDLNAKHESLLANIGEGVIAVDKSENVIYSNVAAQEMLGWNNEEIIGKKYYEALKLKDGQGNDLAREKRPINRALALGKAISTAISEGIFCMKKDGSSTPIAITAAPIFFEGRSVGAIDVFRDITKEAAIDRAKSEFISLASHQLRTPLSAIKWYSETVLSKGKMGKLTKKQEEYMSEIYKSNERMIRLVGDLLSVSRIEMGTLAMKLSDANVKTIIEETMNGSQNIIKEKKIKFKFNNQQEISKISTDPALLRQVIENLISNALAYTPKGGNISCKISKDDNNFIFEIKDNGIGIPKASHARIFEKLYRADNAVKIRTDGTGLGLYIVKKIIDRLNGKIWFESEGGSGSTFWFSLPASPAGGPVDN